MAEGGRDSAGREAQALEDMAREFQECEMSDNSSDVSESDYRRGNALRLVDEDRSLLMQGQESTVSMASQEFSGAPPSYLVQVRDSKGLHVGPRITNNYYYQQGSNSDRISAPPGSRSDSTQLDSEDVAKLRAKSENYQAHCKLKMKDLHVETQPCKEARSQLKNQPTILLVGNSGDGKSSTLDYIAADPLPGYHPIPCSGPEDIEKYIDLVTTTTLLLLFICDQPFGSSCIQQQLVDNWINKGKNLEMHLKNHKFVFATRKSVWNECKTHLHKSLFFCNLLDVSSDKLTQEDKQKMLERYQGESENLTEREKNEIVDEKPIAYAQCCKLMSDAIKRGHTGKKLVEIFKRPFTFLSEEMNKMVATKEEKQKYATLSLIMLCGGEIDCVQLSGTKSDVTPYVRERMDVVVDVCGCKESTCGDLQKCAENLSGTYLAKTQKPGKDSDSCEIYKFSHDSIAEAVTMNYGEFHFRHCLKYLKHDVVLSIVRPKNYEKGEQEFAINMPIEYYGETAGMFTQSVIDGNGSRGLGGVCKNPCVTDEQFQSVWFDYLTKTSPDKLVPFCQSKDGLYGRCVLHHLAKSGADKLLRYLCEHPARQTLTLTCHCRSEDWLPCPIWGAVVGDQTETFIYLQTVYTLSQDVVGWAVQWACWYDSLRVLKVLLSQLHEHRELTIKEGLRWACGYGHVSTVRYLLSEVCTPCDGDQCGCVRGLLAASQKGHTDIVSVIRSSGHKAK